MERSYFFDGLAFGGSAKEWDYQILYERRKFNIETKDIFNFTMNDRFMHKAKGYIKSVSKSQTNILHFNVLNLHFDKKLWKI